MYGEHDQRSEVAKNEKYPKEVSVIVVAQNFNEKSKPDDKEDAMSIRSDVGMSELVDFEEDQDCNDVHERGVELEVHLGRTDVVTTAEDTFQSYGSSQCVEDAIVFRDASSFAPVRITIALSQIFVVNFVSSLSDTTYDNEKDTTDDVSDVAKHVVVIFQMFSLDFA